MTGALWAFGHVVNACHCGHIVSSIYPGATSAIRMRKKWREKARAFSSRNKGKGQGKGKGLAVDSDSDAVPRAANASKCLIWCQPDSGRLVLAVQLEGAMFPQARVAGCYASFRIVTFSN
jgi:hypothetical protein